MLEMIGAGSVIGGFATDKVVLGLVVGVVALIAVLVLNRSEGGNH